MKRKWKVQITKVIRLTRAAPSSVLRDYCVQCDAEVEMLRKAQAAEILDVSEKDLEGLVSEGWMHWIATVRGNLWICKNSLFKK
jgi:hypothetical protein